MSAPRIHFSSRFAPSQIHARSAAPTISLPAEVNRAIETAWHAAKSRLGDRLFDGPMARLDSWQIKGTELHLTFSPTGYKHFLGTNLSNPQLADHFGTEILANPLGISALVQTADGHLIMGRRGGSVAFHAHRVHPLGGTIEHGTADCFAEIRREIYEESSLTAEDIAEMTCVGLAEDPAIRQPELIFHVRTHRALSEISLDPAEHDQIWSTPANPAALRYLLSSPSPGTPGEGWGGRSPLVANDPTLTPIALAALQLWYNASGHKS